MSAGVNKIKLKQAGLVWVSVRFSAQLKRIPSILFLLAAAAGAGHSADLLRFEASAEAMGSTYSVVLYDQDRNKMETAADDAFDEVRRLDSLLSNYRSESEWSKVNSEARERPVAVSEELFDLLSACLQYSRASDGAFDITVGPLMNVWGFYKDSGRLPRPGEVGKALGQLGYRNLILDASKQTVAFARAGMNIDPGGVGKGYAVDRMVDVLKKDGIRTALVSASGSSIYCLGAPPEKAGWTIRIKNPSNEFQHVAEVVLKDQSLSTSGSYEKFFVAEGKTWSHIMDPRTGYPAQGTLSVSVIAPRTLDSEVWAKPYFINGRRWTALHRPRDFRVFFCQAGTTDSALTDQKDKADQSCAWLP